MLCPLHVVEKALSWNGAAHASRDCDVLTGDGLIITSCEMLILMSLLGASLPTEIHALRRATIRSRRHSNRCLHCPEVKTTTSSSTSSVFHRLNLTRMQPVRLKSTMHPRRISTATHSILVDTGTIEVLCFRSTHTWITKHQVHEADMQQTRDRVQCTFLAFLRLAITTCTLFIRSH